MTQSLLPASSTALETNIESALALKFDGINPVIISQIHDPDTCPIEFLQWLAFAENIDNWNNEWSEFKKRNVIRQSISKHKHKGTNGGLRDALEALGINIGITSWHEAEEEKEIGTMHFQLWVEQDNVAFIEDIKKAIDNNKRLSMHYTIGFGVVANFGYASAFTGHTSSRLTLEVIS